MNLRAKVDGFMGHLLAKGKGRPNGRDNLTVAAYRRHLYELVVFLNERDVENLKDATTGDLEDFIRLGVGSPGRPLNKRRLEQRKEVLEEFLAHWDPRTPGAKLTGDASESLPKRGREVFSRRLAPRS